MLPTTRSCVTKTQKSLGVSASSILLGLNHNSKCHQSSWMFNTTDNSNSPSTNGVMKSYNRGGVYNHGLHHVSKRNYVFKGVFLFPGPGYVDLDDGATKPAGVPSTWSSLDIGWPNSDFGFFDEDTFPPAKEGETLEEYCRRVPNIWSPCSKSTDVIDCMAHMDLWSANDLGPSVLGFAEKPLIKEPPFVSDWHVRYVPDYEAMLREMMFRTRPFPVRVTDKEFEVMLQEFERGVNTKGIGHHFKARSFHEFWEELTGKPLKDIANVPTWEEEIDRRIALAKERNAKSAKLNSH